ncbi:MAG: helix-turn-helix transcriptional regulator [Coriobacteriales bacterium]|jgi:DNA-binding CsgD family transcriptional regulator|nr:helix-turn-helix transcriptional regulator [Coriobacteriales bacterium]
MTFALDDNAVAQWPLLLRTTLALALILLSGWLLVYHIFPLYDPAFPVTRDISTAAQGLLFAVLAVIAMRYSSLFKLEPFSIVAIALMPGGVALAFFGVAAASPLIMIISSTLMRIGMAWLQIVVGVSLLRLNPQQLCVCIAVAFIISILIQYLLLLLPGGGIAFAVIPFVTYLLAAPYAKPVFEAFKANEPPFDVRLIRPSSFLPFSHYLFICILVFRIICGFALSFGETGGTPMWTFLSPLPMLVLVAVFIGLKWHIRADGLFEVSALLNIAGFLLVPLTLFIAANPVVSTLLSAGVACFDYLFWFLLISVAGRNPHGAIPVFAWGNSLSCFGLIAGAFFGRAVNTLVTTNPSMLILAVAVLLWVFIVYVLLILKRFSFDAAILAIEPETSAVSPVLDYGSLHVLCEHIAGHYGLTPRESEVFSMLARGRSGRYITDALGISHNTVNAHVKHIYKKLDIHSHQELLDLLERQY